MFFKYLGQTSVNCQKLIKEYLPTYSEKKQKLFKAALDRHKKDAGEILIGRVMCDLSSKNDVLFMKQEFSLIRNESFYDYSMVNKDEDTWFVNFADPILFICYDGDLFAQDEIQTLEMPLLASCRLFLDNRQIEGLITKTNYEGEPTPYLFKNVPYWISVNTRPVLRDGQIKNIYGNNFIKASEEEIEAGIKTFEGDVRCNILAMSAPEENHGYYTKKTIQMLLKTLLCSFFAIREQSLKRVVVHSGNWGCGAFGGNKELMYLSQIYCASVCGINELILHSADEKVLEMARIEYNMIPDNTSFSNIVDHIYKKHYKWGKSDGN